MNINASRLIQNTGDPSARRQELLAVNALHANFCQDFLDADTVSDGIDITRNLLTALKGIDS